MRIYTDEFTLALYIGDNVVDRNLSCGTGCGGYCDDGYTGFLGRCYAFQAAYIFEFRVALKAATPFFTLSIVGLALISE